MIFAVYDAKFALDAYVLFYFELYQILLEPPAAPLRTSGVAQPT